MSEVLVIATSARTPVGLTMRSSAAAVRAGISRISDHPFMIDRNGEAVQAALDPLLPPELMGNERLRSLATPALESVLGRLTEAGVEGVNIPLALAAPNGRGPDPEDGYSFLASAMVETGAQLEYALVPRPAESGHAGTLAAIAQMAWEIQAGRHAIAIVGGVDSYLDADSIDWLESDRKLLSEGVRGGFIPGEGAGFVVLAGSDFLRRNPHVGALGVLQGAGVAEETNLINTNDINTGVGLALALRRALTPAKLEPARPVTVYCDVNGERYRSEEWAFAVLKCGGLVQDSAYSAPSDCWGDLGAASGVLLCGLACDGFSDALQSTEDALVWASSESGLRAAVALTSPSAA